MGEALGSIRIDLLANLSEFTRNVKKAVGGVEEFGRGGMSVVSQLDSAFKGLGNRLSLYVTAPILGVAAAAVHAADPTKKMAQEMERAGLRMQKALVPIGDVLIDKLERAKPTIDATIDLVNGLSRKFAELSPETRDTVLQFTALAAATGPVLLGLAGVTGILKAGGTGFAVLWAAGKAIPTMFGEIAAAARESVVRMDESTASATKLTIATTVLGKTLSSLGALIVGFSAGNWLYESIRPVQETMAKYLAFAQANLQDFVDAHRIAFKVIEHGFDTLLTKLTPPPGLVRFMQGVMDATAPGSGSAMAAGVLNHRPMATTLNGDIADIILENKRARDAINESLRLQLDGISQAFQGQQFREVPFFAPVIDGAESLKGSLEDVINRVKIFGSEAIEAGRGASTAMVQTAEETRKAKEASEKLAREMDKAKELRFQAYPRERLQDDIKNLEELAKKFPELLDPQAVSTLTEKWTKDFEKLANKGEEAFSDRLAGAIKDFSENVSDYWADMLVDGEASFEALAKSFEKMLISMTLKQYAFQPIFGAIGGAVGSIFAAGGGSVNPEPGTIGPPVTVGQSSELFLARAGNSGVIVNVYDQSGGTTVQERQEGGTTILDILVPGIQSAFASGKLDRTMEAKYGLKPRPRF